MDWEKLEDHILGFVTSEQYLERKKLLHHYYDSFPVTEHYEIVLGKIKLA